MELKPRAFMLSADEGGIVEIAFADDIAAVNRMRRAIKSLEETGSNDAELIPLFANMPDPLAEQVIREAVRVKLRHDGITDDKEFCSCTLCHYVKEYQKETP